jgi:hypothetical protein
MRRSLVGLVLVPLIGPPLFLGGLILADTLSGEGLFLYQLSYEQRLLATQFVSDSVAALPGAYLVAALLVGVGLGARQLLGAAHVRRWMSAAGAVVGLALGSLLAGTPSDPGAWALAVSGLLFAAAMSLPLGQLLQARDAARSAE